ncbi:hypothetical protein J2046_002437 [Rhizobium petrolearium]|nr:hypothetical protein [Neorhizobium petrolearium]
MALTVQASPPLNLGCRDPVKAIPATWDGLSFKDV